MIEKNLELLERILKCEESGFLKFKEMGDVIPVDVKIYYNDYGRHFVEIDINKMVKTKIDDKYVIIFVSKTKIEINGSYFRLFTLDENGNCEIVVSEELEENDDIEKIEKIEKIFETLKIKKMDSEYVILIDEPSKESFEEHSEEPVNDSIIEPNKGQIKVNSWNPFSWFRN